MPDRGTLLDLLKGSTATLALFLASVSIPLAGVFSGIVAPLPGLYFSWKRGPLLGAAIIAVAAGSIAALADLATLLLYLVQCGIITLILPLMVRQGRGGTWAIVITTATATAALLAMAVIYQASSGTSVHGLVVRGMSSQVEQATLLYEKSGVVSGDDLAYLKETMAQTAILLGRIYPALTVVGLGVVAAINLTLFGKVASRLPHPPVLGDFRRFKNPEWLVWVLITAGFAMLVPQLVAKTVAMNVLVVTLSLYFCQGLAVVAQVFTRYAVPGFVRIIFYLFLALQPYLAVALAALGIFDLWGDFRTPRQPKNL